MTNRTIAQLEAELHAARAAEAQLAADKAAKVAPKFAYTITPAAESERRHSPIFDDTCTLYRIAGKCVNREESEAAGNRPWSDGGMIYVFNTVTQKIIMSVGGGTIYISDPWYSGDKKGTSAGEAFAEVNAFLARHPEGGDITGIVMRHKSS